MPPRADRPLNKLAALYLVSLALLPWSTFPPFPWLHENAQWSDGVFAVTVAVWVCWRRPAWRGVHLALLAYVVAAGWALAWNPRTDGFWKWIGVVELVALAAVTTDLAAVPGMRRAIARVTTGTAWVVAGAGLVGLILFFAAGISTPILGTYGDLLPSPWYTRLQVGAIHPNLLASWCVFAAACIARDDGTRRSVAGRIALVALSAMVLLTFSRVILSFAVGVAVWAAPDSRRRRVAWVFGGTAAMGVLALTVLNPRVDPTRPFEARLLSEPGPRRIALLSAAATAVENPLHGCGLDCHPAQVRGIPMDAHFTPVNVAAVLGLPGLAALLWVIGRVWRERARPADIAVWCALLAVAIEALATDVEDFRHVWILFGLAMASLNGSANLEDRRIKFS